MNTCFFLPYLPAVSWMVAYAQTADAVIEACENFQKSTPRNRTRIATASGPLLLSIPLAEGRDKHRPYTAVRISYSENWQVKHWRSITSAYQSAAYFAHYAPQIEPFYKEKYEFLFEYNLALLQKLLQLLHLNIPPVLTNNYLKGAYTCDYRSGEPAISLPRYPQVFEERIGFQPGVSVIDLLFNQGPDAARYLLRTASVCTI
ncbi:MAG: WbqC family protein [Chitinophagales bacterium]|nr:WbqC family protein [Chitinophagales bacterium]MDW8418810.1 WbqC family protein [Chitinophagales bacterium]